MAYGKRMSKRQNKREFARYSRIRKGNISGPVIMRGGPRF